MGHSKYNFDNVQAMNHICRVLRIKPVNKNKHSFYVRKYSTLQRISKWIKKGLLYSLYPNNDGIKESDEHYWLDAWSNSNLFTIRCDKK